MKTIWKYPLRIQGCCNVLVPGSAQLLFVGRDPQKAVCAWFEVSDSPVAALRDQALHPVDIFFVGTGNPIPEKARTYVTTILDNPFVWHIYTL